MGNTRKRAKELRDQVKEEERHVLGSRPAVTGFPRFRNLPEGRCGVSRVSPGVTAFFVQLSPHLEDGLKRRGLIPEGSISGSVDCTLLASVLLLPIQSSAPRALTSDDMTRAPLESMT